MQIMKNFEKTEFSRKILIHLFPISWKGGIDAFFQWLWCAGDAFYIII